MENYDRNDSQALQIGLLEGGRIQFLISEFQDYRKV